VKGDMALVTGNNFYNHVGKVRGTDSILSRQVISGRDSAGDFGRILQEKLEQSSDIKFSKHAEMRLQARNITLSQAQKDKINEAVRRAEAKGVKDSLVLMDGIAFVINIKNKTVVTAVNNNELKENVFTNIDGAVIL